MVGFLRSVWMPRTPSGRRSARPMLEWLEGRAVPASLTLDVSYGVGQQVTLSGNLTDTSFLENQAIEIEGAASGTTFTDSTGHFTLTVEASALGDVYAYAPGLECNPPSVELTDEVPEVTWFQAIEGPNRIWTFYGTVSYSRPFESLQLYFGGEPISLQGEWTSANSQGQYQFLKELNGTQSDNGIAWAQAISPWGTVSEYRTDLVHQSCT